MNYDYFGKFNEEGTLLSLEVFEVEKKEDLGKTEFYREGFYYLGNNISTGIEPEDIFIGHKKYNEVYVNKDGELDTYNPLDFSKSIEIQKLKEQRQSDALIDKFVDDFGAYPNDRSKKLSYLFPDAMTPLPTMLNKNTSFKDAIQNKIEEIKSKDMEYSLMWSGGIDSTLVFYLLVDNDIDFNVAMGINSKLEYPKLYNEICNGTFKNVKKIIDLTNNRNELDNTVIITGEIGDQLVGSDRLVEFSYVERNKPFREVLKEEDYMPYLVSIKEVLGTDKLTTAEFMWGMNFVFKYDNVIRRMNSHLEDIKHNGIIHFFNSDLFQQWSLQNYKESVSFYRIREYKQFYKDLIYSFNNDQDYRLYKTKQSSLKNLAAGE